MEFDSFGKQGSQMLIRLQQINGKGFMTLRKPFEFIVSNYEGKTVQIDGQNKDDEKSRSNGSGKSTLLESFCWGWFGELCRKNRYKDEIISKKEKQAFIRILFQANEIGYKIERTIERKKTPSLRIWKAEQDLVKDGYAHYIMKELLVGATYQTKQVELEKILQMNFLSFQCAIMFGRDFMNFPDLKPAERAKILTDVRGLDKYVSSSLKAGESAKALQSLVAELERSIVGKEGKLSGIRSTSYKISIDNFESERTSELLSWEQDIGAKENLIEEKNFKIEEEKSRIQNEISTWEARQNLLSVSSSNRKERSDIFANHQSELNNILFQRDSHKKSIDKLNAEIQKLTKNGEGPCPFCGQIVTGKYLQSKINQIGLEVMEINAELDSLSSKETSVRDFMRTDRELLNKLDKETEELDRVKSAISNLKIKLARASGDSTIAILESNIKTLKNNIKIKTGEINPYIEMEEKRKGQIKELGAEIRGMNETKKGLLDKKKYFDFWIDGFKKIRMMLFDSMISQLESLAQHYLSQYSSELNIIMTTERETRSGTIKDEFHIAIVDSNGDEVSYEMYSGGERQKIRLSISRALSQFIKEGCGVDFSLIAFDEPNDSLDDLGKDVNFETFQTLSETDGKAVLVTDHDSTFKDKFDHHILVVKENGESIIHV
jgi:DNA repair exonuclease SbcCD ATPase subunit